MALLAFGCGGSPTPEYVTRAREAEFDRDALVLAARDSTGTRVSIPLAKALDSALKDARSTVPELAGSHAALDYDPHKIHVTISDSAPWRSAWDSGSWRTGVSGFDNVLEPLNPSGIRLFSTSGDQKTYEITLETWIRAKAVAYSLYNQSSSISRAGVVTPSIEQPGGLTYEADPETGAPTFSLDGTTYRKTGASWSKVTLSSARP